MDLQIEYQQSDVVLLKPQNLPVAEARICSVFEAPQWC